MSTLDALLAEAEGALSPAGGGGGEPVASAVCCAAVVNSQPPGDSPLPPPPSFFAQVGAALSDEPAAAADCETGLLAGDSGGAASRVPTGKSAAKLRKNAASATRCRQVDGAGPPQAGGSADSEAARPAPLQCMSAVAPSHEWAVRAPEALPSDTAVYQLEPELLGSTPSSEEDNMVPHEATEVRNKVGEHASAGLQGSSRGTAAELIESADRGTPGVEGSAVICASMSPEEFKEKVDRKIAYFETLARESRIKAEEDAALEQSLQEARSRIEASATKRQSLLLSSAKRGPRKAALPTEDAEQDRRCLSFGTDSLSLQDLTNDGAEGSIPEVVAAKVARSQVLLSDDSESTSNNIFDTVQDVRDDALAREDAAVAGITIAMHHKSKAMFGISPVLEATTPDISGDKSPCESSACKQQMLFGQGQLDCSLRLTTVVADESELQEENSATMPSVQAGGSVTCTSAQSADTSIVQVKSEAWAGALACATPIPEHDCLPRLTEREGEGVQTDVHVHDGRKRDNCKHALILGKLDNFLDSLRSPYGATAIAAEVTSGSLETAEDGPPPARQIAGDMDSSGNGAEDGGEEKKRRAAARRTAFLAGMNQLMEKKQQDSQNSCTNSEHEDLLEQSENLSLQSLERRAQHLSEIASCDVSLTNCSSTVGLGGDPHRSNTSAEADQQEKDATWPLSVAQCASILGSAPNGIAGSSISATSFRNDSETHDGPNGESEAEKPAGIGVQVKRVRGLITIVDLMPDGPAAKYLKKGQIILQIDGSGEG